MPDSPFFFKGINNLERTGQAQLHRQEKKAKTNLESPSSQKVNLVLPLHAHTRPFF